MTKAKTAAPAAQDTPAKAPEVNADELSALNEALATKEGLTEDAQEKISKLEAENESLKAVIGELNAALAAKDGELEEKGGFPIIKDGKDSYELRLKKFVHRIDGKAIEMDEAYLKSHPEVVKDLIARKSGALVKKGGK